MDVMHGDAGRPIGLGQGVVLFSCPLCVQRGEHLYGIGVRYRFQLPAGPVHQDCFER